MEIYNNEDLKYLKLLSKSFKNIAEASTEIINLEAILNLPKGTEHFLTDIHGEYEAFNHVLRNASGVIKRKINDIFGNQLTPQEQNNLCTLIYYPEQKLELIKPQLQDINSWYKKTILQLIEVCRNVSSKYTRSKVRKSLPKDFAYIIEELLHETEQKPNKMLYVNGIISSIIDTRRADKFIGAISQVIQQLTIDSLHIVGDIYDRGPGAHIVMETLEKFHKYDVQWGNHDILWMGAASGSEACIANVIRISLRYANLETLEDGYGINLLPLATFAMETYVEDPCSCFMPKIGIDSPYTEKTTHLIAQMHKAITIIQFKLEHSIIKRNPYFRMESRNLLDKIDFADETISIKGQKYPLKDTNFPSIDPKNPYQLTPEEENVMQRLSNSFTHSEKLERHIRSLYHNGSLFLLSNKNLLYHASIPLNEDGSFKEVKIGTQLYKGRKLLEIYDKIAREAFFKDEKDQYAKDTMWYLWCGPDSPLFDKDQMTTFERYFISDKQTHKENKGQYYKLINNEAVCVNILREFGLEGSSNSHIINGHVPVKAKEIGRAHV